MRGSNDSLIPVKERQIEGAKIRIKVLIDELLIDAEIVGVGCALGLNACLQRDEVEPVRDVLAGAHQHIATVLHDQNLQHIDIRYELEGVITTKRIMVFDGFIAGLQDHHNWSINLDVYMFLLKNLPFNMTFEFIIWVYFNLWYLILQMTTFVDVTSRLTKLLSAEEV